MKYRIKQWFKMFAQNVLFPVIYFFNKFKRVDKELIVLADSHHENCPEHMKEIRDYLYARNFKVQDFFFDSDKLGMFNALKKMMEFMALYPKCGYVIICDNFLPIASCEKRKGTKVIQLWHGCGAFKKFGYQAKDDVPEYYKGEVYRNYDVVTVSGQACVKSFETAMRLPNKIMPLGVSHTDRLFDSNYIETCKDKLAYEHPDSKGKKIVLWAPTFRGKASKGTYCGEDYINNLKLTDFVCENCYVIKSIHPHLERLGNTDDCIMSTDELIACADVLITDYSSVFFEYLLLDKPIIFFAPDYEKYAKERGFYLDYGNLPGIVINGGTVLPEQYQSFLNNGVEEALTDDKFRDKRFEFRSLYMHACDGNATQRIVEKIL